MRTWSFKPPNKPRVMGSEAQESCVIPDSSSPGLEMLLTFIVAVWVARGAEKAAVVHGLFIGILAGLLSLALTLPFGGRFDLHNLLFLLIVVVLGWLGGFVGHKGRKNGIVA
jgi:hypothetical protein